MADQSYGAPETIVRAKALARKISRDREIDGLKPAASRYEVPVEGARGLLVVVWPSGRKRFVLRYVSQAGERRRLPLGDHSKAFKLADAKKQADIHRASVAKDQDPAAERTKARRSARTGETLDELQVAYQKAAKLGLHGGRQKPRRQSALDHDQLVYDAYIAPRLGRRRFKQISKSDVLGFVRQLKTEPCGKTKRPLSEGTAAGVLAVLRGLLAFAMFEERIESNPAVGIKLQKPEPRQRPMSEATQRAIWKAVAAASVPRKESPDHGIPLDPITSLSLRLLALTGLRRSELAGARWDEIDMVRRLWVVPGERMKAGRPHKIPLVESTLEVLRLIEATTAHRQSQYLFPAVGDPSSAMGASSLTHALARLCRHLDLPRHSPHDVRKTMTTVLRGQYRVDPGITSMLLDHEPDGGARVTRQHYDFGEYLDQRREALIVWAGHLDALLVDGGDA